MQHQRVAGLERLVEGDLVPKVILHPAVGLDVAAQCPVVRRRAFPGLYPAGKSGLGVVAAKLYVLRIDQQVTPSAGIFEFVAGDALRAGDVHPGAVVRQIHRVVPRRGLLSFLPACIILPVCIGERHYQHIAERGHAGAAQPVLRESHQQRIGPVVAAAVLPEVVSALGAGLHHSERAGGRRGRMAGVICTDKGVDPSAQRTCAGGHEQAGKKKEEKRLFHITKIGLNNYFCNGRVKPLLLVIHI